MSGKKGVIDLIVNKLHMNEDDEEEFYDNGDDPYYDEGDNIEPFRQPRNSRSDQYDDYPEQDHRRPSAPKKPAPKPALSVPSRKASKNAGGMNVCVIKPTSVEEAREITETLLEDRTVVLNLEGLDVDIAQRIIDFTSGSTYAIDGNLQKISRYIFIITPASVDISGDFQDLLAGSMSQGGPQHMID
ncbi:MAG: cell division protein SepF [Lachnospiraceae bacterium]|nr:cell division protein SepF [Lachnospiraceae bacterium]